MARFLEFSIESEYDTKIAVINTGKYLSAFTCDDSAIQSISTVVSELGINIVKYAKFGKITVEHIKKGRKYFVEVVATDNGPGIKNVSKALEDNFSTTGTLGLGLPGVNRLMDELIIDSNSSIGTCITTRKKISA